MTTSHFPGWPSSECRTTLGSLCVNNSILSPAGSFGSQIRLRGIWLGWEVPFHAIVAFSLCRESGTEYGVVRTRPAFDRQLD